VQVISGEKVTRPADPVKEGYIFKGWCIGSTTGEYYDFNSPVTDDIKLFAAWYVKIDVTDVTSGNSQTNINFSIKSANGKGYSVYLSNTGNEGSYKPYDDVNYNAKGVQIKGLTNGKIYYVFIEYNDGYGNISRSEPVRFTPASNTDEQMGGY
jgi:uncharacterized repeat protein (TIGR02543 family)